MTTRTHGLPVVFIAGSTATGKTRLATQLSEHYEVDLINVDAAQVYREMDVGTAKLTKAEQKQFPHQLIDIRDPKDSYDAAQFRQDALKAIDASHKSGRIPVLVGGSLFYFAALENGVSNLPAADPALRAQLDAEGERLGWAALHQRLASIDPVLGKRIDCHDQQRIQRALEIHALTKAVPSEVMKQAKPQPLDLPLFKFNLVHPDRKALHQTIAVRFKQMLQDGLVDEVKALRARGDLSLELPSMRCVGYRQVWQHLDGEHDEQTMIDKSTAATRQLAKRQLTWLRNQRGQIWLCSKSQNNVDFMARFFDETKL